LKPRNIFLLIASGLLLTAHGARMLYMALFTSQWYRPNTFDVLFDWTPVTIIGVTAFIVGCRKYYQYKQWK